MEGLIPNRLLTLQRGSHRSDESGACAMEAASWLAGEPWSDHPRAVHPVIADVARAANDALADEDRQKLWPLILGSIGTGRCHRPMLAWHLRRVVQKTCAGARDGKTLVHVWEALLVEFERRVGPEYAPAELTPRRDTRSTAPAEHQLESTLTL